MSSPLSPRHSVKIAAATLLAVAVLPIWVGAASAASDLIVNAGTLFGDKVVVGGGVKHFSWNHRTKNVGNTPSPRSETSLEFRAVTPEGASLVVPRLAPGHFRIGNGSFQYNFKNWEFGTHPTRICADALDVVKESKEGNNCGSVAPIHVVPSRFVGRVTGEVKALPPRKTFDVTWAADVTYEFSRVINGVIIDYTFSETSVVYNVHGTDAIGCTYSGTGTYKSPPEDIRLWFRPHSVYRADHVVSANFSFPVTQRCDTGNPITVRFSPFTKQWFSTGGFRLFQNPGLEALRGAYIQNVTGLQKITFFWNFKAE
jgi:hypothetical protein